MAHDFQHEHVPTLGRGGGNIAFAGIDLVVLGKLVPIGEQAIEFLANDGIGVRHLIERRAGLLDVEESWTPLASDEHAEERIQGRLEDMVVDLHDPDSPRLLAHQTSQNGRVLPESHVIRRRAAELAPLRE